MWGQIGLTATFNSGMDTFTPALTFSIINGKEKFNTIEENGNDRPYSSFSLTASLPQYVASPTGISDSRLPKYNFIANFVIDSLSATVGNKNLVLQQFFIDSNGEEFGHLDYLSAMTKAKDGIFGNCSLWIGRATRDWGNYDKTLGTKNCVLRICSGSPSNKGDYQILAEYKFH